MCWKTERDMFLQPDPGYVTPAFCRRPVLLHGGGTSREAQFWEWRKIGHCAFTFMVYQSTKEGLSGGCRCPGPPLRSSDEPGRDEGTPPPGVPSPSGTAHIPAPEKAALSPCIPKIRTSSIAVRSAPAPAALGRCSATTTAPGKSSW